MKNLKGLGEKDRVFLRGGAGGLGGRVVATPIHTNKV